MTDPVAVKICGLTTAEQVACAVEAGAGYIGLNFFARSPRSVSMDTARALAVDVPLGVAKVGLVVDEDNDFLDQLCQTVPLDMIQLHGRETPERVAEVKARYGLPVMKAIGISTPEDTAQIDRYGVVADVLLIDAKAPKGAVLPGGNGAVFDWTLVQRKYWPCPWMLAGGLTPANVGRAISMTRPKVVDVSSGVESAPGVKDRALMADFVASARGVPLL